MVFSFDISGADRWRRPRARRAARLCVLLLGLAGVLTVCIEWQRKAALGRLAHELLADTAPPSPRTADGGTTVDPERPRFRHSVVMGGVYTRDDVVRAVQNDAVVRAHYQDIDVEQVRAERLARPRQAYVSYRLGDKVFWTRRPVTIAAGETVLSDGTSAIRARCGNRISDVPMEPTSGVAGAEGELDEPIEEPAARVHRPGAPAMPQIVPFFPGPGTEVSIDAFGPAAGGPSQLFPVAGLFGSGFDPDELNPPGGGNPPGGNPPGGNPPGGNPPEGDPPPWNPPGWDPPGGDPPCCGIPPIDVPPIDEPPDDPPPSVPEPGPLVLLAVGAAAVAVQRLLQQRHED